MPGNEKERGRTAKMLMSRRTTITRGIAVAVALGPIVLWLSGAAGAQPAHHCSSAATEQARKLLAFHFGPDNRIEIDRSVKTLAPIRNPADRTQRFDVVEVWGYIYKGQYRMRFIYARLPMECVLMGQEILEYASL
jgi:hypothetical protein